MMNNERVRPVAQAHDEREAEKQREMNMKEIMTMAHSEKSHIHRMKAWPYRQECRGHGPTIKNLFYWCILLVGKVCRYKLLEDRLYRNGT